MQRHIMGKYEECARLYRDDLNNAGAEMRTMDDLNQDFLWSA